MSGLGALIESPGGRTLLAQRGISLASDEFHAALRAPVSDALNVHLGLPSGTKLIHVGQQVCADYRRSTVAKFTLAAEVERPPGVRSALLWHDCDRAESERYGMRVVLPSGQRQVGVWLAPRGLGSLEPRFIPVTDGDVRTALERLREWARQRMAGAADRAAAAARVDALGAAIAAARPRTLAALNAAIAEFLLEQAHRVRLPTATLSEMTAAGMFTASVERYLNNLEAVIRVLNETVDDLRARGADPGIRRLEDDYLPLMFSCDRDGTRLRLTRESAGGHTFATASCRCGRHHRFALGARELRLDELAATGRWTPDVSLPVHHNHLASGWIVGRSTALYGMVFNAVLTRALGLEPIPALVAVPPAAGPDGDDETLLTAYLASAAG